MASSRNTPEHETTTDDIIPAGPDGVTVPSDINQILTNVCRSVSILQGNGDITVDKERSDYVRTPALDEADDILQRTGWVILCGPPGCGKTTLAYALSRRCRDQGFSPYILERLELWRPSIGRDERSVVVLDGALGQVRVTSEQHDCWKQILDTVLELMKKNTCKLVITVYPHVLRELQQLERTWASPLRGQCAVVHMTEALPEHIKKNLLNFHLNKLDLTPDTQRDTVQKVLQNDISGPVFPWCCNHMLKHWDSSTDPTSIFLMPAEAYAELLKELALHHSHGPVFAAVFALSMRGLFNFLNHPLQATPHLQELGCKAYSDDKLARYADLLQGFVLSESGSGFSSRVLYEATGLALGRSFRLPILLRVCDVTFLVQYVHATAVEKTLCEGVFFNIRVSIGSAPCYSTGTKYCAEDSQSLVERICMEIVEGNRLLSIIQHPSLQCPEFLKELDMYCSRDHKRIKQLLNTVDHTYKLPLTYWSACQPSHTLTHWCLFNAEENRKLSAQVLMACSLFDSITQNSECRLSSVLRETLMPEDFKHLGNSMDFPLIGKDQCLRKEIQKQIEIIAGAGSDKWRLLYLCDPSLPIPAHILTVQMIQDKLQLQVKDRRRWYLVLRLLTDREVGETDQDGNSLLHIAVNSGELATVELCLKSGAQITQQNKQGLTPYQLAHKARSSVPKNRKALSIEENFRRIPELDMAEMQLLLLQEISVDDKDDAGSTGLLVACREDHQDIANLFIKLGADVSMEDTVPCLYFCEHGQETHECCTPLHYACKNGMVETVALLIQNQAVVNATTSSGETALHLACLYSSPAASAEITHLLVQASADIHTKNAEGNSPVLCTASQGLSDAAEALICYGADVNTRNKKGQTPALCAVMKGHCHTVEMLIHYGANVNTQDENGNTPLLCAVGTGQIDTAELLMRHVADVNTQDENDNTPLMCAVKKGHSDIAELLMFHGASINRQDENGNTPILCAAESGHSHIVEMLIDHDADVNTQNRWGDTPLLCAARNGHLCIVRLLICHDAEVNIQDDNGSTALHCAARNGQSETADFLISCGVDINGRDETSDTPLQCAIKNGHSDIIEMLMRHGADISKHDE